MNGIISKRPEVRSGCTQLCLPNRGASPTRQRQSRNLKTKTIGIQTDYEPIQMWSRRDPNCPESRRSEADTLLASGPGRLYVYCIGSLDRTDWMEASSAGDALTMPQPYRDSWPPTSLRDARGQTDRQTDRQTDSVGEAIHASRGF